MDRHLYMTTGRLDIMGWEWTVKGQQILPLWVSGWVTLFSSPLRSPFVAIAFFMAVICLVCYQTGSLSKLHYHAAQIVPGKLSGSFNRCYWLLRYVEPRQVFAKQCPRVQKYDIKQHDEDECNKKTILYGI